MVTEGSFRKSVIRLKRENQLRIHHSAIPFHGGYLWNASYHFPHKGSV